MINELIKLSNHFDSKGLRREADYLDAMIRKVAAPLTPLDTALPEIGENLKEGELREAVVQNRKVINFLVSHLIEYFEAGKSIPPEGTAPDLEHDPTDDYPHGLPV